MKKSFFAIILSALMLTACGSSGNSSTIDDISKNTEQTTTTTAVTTAEPEVKEPRSVKVMLLGDSITDGFWLAGGYRTFLCDKLEENGYSQYVDFVGRNNSGDCYDGDHEGYTAFAIERFPGRQGIMSMTKKIFEKSQPDVICLQIGTNDILDHHELETVDERLEALVDVCFENLPDDGFLYLATIPCMDANDTTYINASVFTPDYMDQCINDFNEKVKALVEKKKGEGKNIELADVYGVFGKEDLYDGVHPNEEGYKKMGEFWYGKIVDFITE